MTNNKAKAILFIEGFVSVALQIFTIRQITPFSGSNITNTSLVIGIFLAFLALGYNHGGKIKEKHRDVLARNFILSSIIITFAFSYSFIEAFFSINFVTSNTLTKTAAYLLLFLSPVVYLLGQTMPILVNFIRKNTTSEATGTVLSVNTIGSVIGTIFTPLILFKYFGIALTLSINVALLLFLYIYLKRNSISIFISMLVLSLSLTISLNIDNKQFLKTNEYSNYEILNTQNAKILRVNNSNSSLLDRLGSPAEYILIIRKTISSLGSKNSSVLVLGAGGFTLSHNDKTKRQYTYIDLDSEIQEIAENHLLKNKISGEYITEDARVHLNKTRNNKYDFIVTDLFTHKMNMPWHTTTHEFMQTIESNLNDGGYAIFNIISTKGFSGSFTQNIDNTIQRSFSFCYKQPVFYKNSKYINLIYTCRKNKDNDSKYVYRDNQINMEIDIRKEFN